MKAVHFGAGNIGRGFVGVLLKEAGYELVFADVAAELIEALNNADSYTVHEVGPGGSDITISGFRGINSARDPEALAEEIATADVITTAVGPNILKFVAANIARGLQYRARSGTGKVTVMACENAINATDMLAEQVRKHYPDADKVAVFANTAVDRIVPAQDGEGLDVKVEPYYEWAIETPPFAGKHPSIPGATWVEDLAPYISRKLFTVNTGHATCAYYGYVAEEEKISDALANPEVNRKVRAVLGETKNLIVRKFGFSEETQQAYIEKILTRFANPHLPDTVARVGRSPLRKLSRNERFISPAASLAEAGLETDALVDAVGAALRFEDPEDPEAIELQQQLRQAREAELPTLVERLSGISPKHPLYASLHDVYARRLAEL